MRGAEPRRIVGALAALCIGCASGHTMPAVRDDPERARALERWAERSCESAHPGDTTERRPFTTDGCSAWPDGAYGDPCCIEHDLVYWCGGSRAERRAADRRFEECVAARSGPFLAAWMRLGVGIGGSPVWPTPWRWGYGSDYRGRYGLDAGD